MCFPGPNPRQVVPGDLSTRDGLAGSCACLSRSCCVLSMLWPTLPAPDLLKNTPRPGFARAAPAVQRPQTRRKHHCCFTLGVGCSCAVTLRDKLKLSTANNFQKNARANPDLQQILSPGFLWSERSERRKEHAWKQ
jgi:hypothetical protein